MKKLARVLLVTLMVTAFAAAVTGCNTIRGAGQDVEEVGDTVEDAATD